MPCFFIGCYWRIDVYKNDRSPALLFLFCFGRGTSVARRDQGGGLALLESGRGFCRSRYDAKNPKSTMKTVHHWRPTLMHLGCMIEMLHLLIMWLMVSSLSPHSLIAILLSLIHSRFDIIASYGVVFGWY